MWKIKLDDTFWLGQNSEATTTEKQALLLPDMPSVQAQLMKVRRFMPYPNAMVVAAFEDNQVPVISE
ncbi:MAG: hypothetical protein IZT55_00505 [Anaerolineae bacterium]|nr:hypothetical protein [Anaerolineae bacterium]